MKFVDQARIKVVSGNGGSGCLSFRREAYVPKGGPDGGDGGHGGDVVVLAESSMDTLLDCRYRQLYRAKNGGNGMGSNRHGKSAPDLIVRVPVGTQVYDDVTGELIADLDQDTSQIIVAPGGRGGRGNARFATPWNRAPRRYEEGIPGQERELRLELKLIADVGLVGLPNSGKSTFLSRVSNARPEIGAYPFTTKVPMLGVVHPPEGKAFVLADIPGLIRDAHKGAGMGDRFLRHVERTKLLLHLVDPSAEQDGEPLERFDIIMSELASYSPRLLDNPMIVIITKMDIPENQEPAETLRTALEPKGFHVHEISAVTGRGVPDVLRHAGLMLKDLLQKKAPLAPRPKQPTKGR